MKGEWDETLELQKQNLLDCRAFAGTVVYVLHAPLHPLCFWTEL